ncbi:hypothetical protein [Streptomyces sp. TM32]|uniref:hypothetical protein n=1 Tax=Streptomyces sp. TM32 TaxID=1652669 RepID=UPI0020B12094|nr:hypothetical protein [Streptomyces sp. TM32]
MMTNPDIIFAADPNRGLVARSGWEQAEARTVLRDLGWEWEEEMHVLVPPNDVAEADAGVQAVKELHLHGYRTGYAVGPYGAMRLTLDRAEQVFTMITEQQRTEAVPRSVASAEQRPAGGTRPSAYSSTAASAAPHPSEPDAPAI